MTSIRYAITLTFFSFATMSFADSMVTIKNNATTTVVLNVHPAQGGQGKDKMRPLTLKPGATEKVTFIGGGLKNFSMPFMATDNDYTINWQESNKEKPLIQFQTKCTTIHIKEAKISGSPYNFVWPSCTP